MLIADSQVHIWAASTPERPWPAGKQPPHKANAFSPAELLKEMKAAGVQRAILVPPSWEGDRNDLSLAAAQAAPDTFGVMGKVDIDSSDAVDNIKNWRKDRGLYGFRFTFAKPANWGPLAEGRIDWVWEAAEAAGCPLMLSAGPTHIHLLERVAARHPKLKVTIDHLGLANGKKDDEAFAGLDKLLAMAKYPNVSVKASSMPSYSTEPYPFKNLHDRLQRVYGAYGANRVFWGSDLSRLEVPYRQCVTLFTEELKFLTASDLEWTMGRGLCEWLGWKI